MIPDEYLVALSSMLNEQRMMQENVYGFGPLDKLTDEQKMEWVRNNVLALEDELHEALAETGWKPWATSNHINQEAFRSELIDAWHFFMNLMLIAGMDAESLFSGYFNKADKNKARQVAGYDGVKGKCSICHRALDDDAVSCTENWCNEFGLVIHP